VGASIIGVRVNDEYYKQRCADNSGEDVAFWILTVIVAALFWLMWLGGNSVR